MNGYKVLLYSKYRVCKFLSISGVKLCQFIRQYCKLNQNQGKQIIWTFPFNSILIVQTSKQVQGWPQLSCDQFQLCPCWPVHYTPLATASAPIYLSLPTRAGERSLSKPTGTATAPTAQVQRLNNRKHVQYINISADSNLSMGKQGLHKGLRTEDVTSDRAGGDGQAFSLVWWG